MKSRRSFFARLVVSTALVSSLFVGSHAFVPSVYGCGSGNATDCRTSTSSKSDSGESSFLVRLRFLIDAVDALLP